MTLFTLCHPLMSEEYVRVDENWLIQFLAAENTDKYYTRAPNE